MINSLAPLYLPSLIPPTVNSLSRYNLRNSDNLQTIDCRTNRYSQSFQLSTVRAWNNPPPPPEAKQTDSLNYFKHFLNTDKSYVPKYYYFGKYLKNTTDSPLVVAEVLKILNIPFFSAVTTLLKKLCFFDAISGYCEITLHLLLFGDTSLSHDTNKNIFQQVQKYISDTKLF